MRITKRQLKRIIKEEKDKLLRETMGDDYAKMGNFDRYSDQYPENDPKLYVNLSGDQLDALEDLEQALEACRATKVPIADIMDTVQAGTGY